MNVLIVDDKAENLYLLQAILAGHEFFVASAREGREALEKAHQSPPDLIISDILMPGMDGFALCREWRQAPELKDIPFMFYTATYTDPQDKQFALDLGADRFLIKPMEPDAFMVEVRQVLEDRASFPGIAVRQPCATEAVIMRQYNQALIRKLEKKLDDRERDLALLAESERRLDEINRILRGVHLVSHLIAQEKEPANLLRLACEGLVRGQSFPSAWAVRFPEGLSTPEGFQSGLPEALFRTFLKLFHDGELPPCCQKREDRTERPCHDRSSPCPLEKISPSQPWIVHPLEHEGQIFGFLGLTPSPIAASTPEALSLSREVAADLAFALHTMREENRRRQAEALRRAIFDHAQDGIILVRGDSLRIVMANEAMARLVGIPVEELVLLYIEDIQAPEDLPRMRHLFEAVATKEPHLFCDVPLKRRDGSVVLTDVNSCPLELEGHLHSLGIFRDITRRKEAEDRITQLLRDKELLLHEVHHRIKNNMASISSMLRLQARQQKNTDITHELDDAACRVQSAAVLYDRIYRSQRVCDISLKSYLPSLLQEILQSFPHQESIAVETALDDTKACTNFVFGLGIVVTELATNALKHAFCGRDRGRLRLAAFREEERFVLEFEDDGVGLPEEFSLDAPAGFGLHLVQILVLHFQGTITAKGNGGTRFRMEYPLAEVVAGCS